MAGARMDVMVAAPMNKGANSHTVSDEYLMKC